MTIALFILVLLVDFYEVIRSNKPERIKALKILALRLLSGLAIMLLISAELHYVFFTHGQTMEEYSYRNMQIFSQLMTLMFFVMAALHLGAYIILERIIINKVFTKEV